MDEPTSVAAAAAAALARVKQAKADFGADFNSTDARIYDDENENDDDDNNCIKWHACGLHKHCPTTRLANIDFTYRRQLASKLARSEQAQSR